MTLRSYKLDERTAEGGCATRTRRGFTLIELLVVIAIIALIVAMVLPSMVGLFTAGAEKQARNIMSGVLASARGLAIEKQNYTLVHVQMGKDGRCWAVIMELSPIPDQGSSTVFRTFIPAMGTVPRQLPQGVALGKVDEFWVQPKSATDSTGRFLSIRSDSKTDNSPQTIRRELRCFTDFNVIFTPEGSAAKSVNGHTPLLANRIYPCDGSGAFVDVRGDYGPAQGPAAVKFVRLYGPGGDFSRMYPTDPTRQPPASYNAILWQGTTGATPRVIMRNSGGAGFGAWSMDGLLPYCPGSVDSDDDWFTAINAAGLPYYQAAIFAGDRIVRYDNGTPMFSLDGGNTGYGVLSMVTFPYSTLSVLPPLPDDTSSTPGMTYSTDEASYLSGGSSQDMTNFALHDKDYLMDGKTPATSLGGVVGTAQTKANYLTSPPPGSSTALFITISPYTGRVAQE